MREELKIEIADFYLRHEDAIIDILMVVFIPIWVPLFIIIFPFFYWDVEIMKDDEEWCKEQLNKNLNKI